MFCLTDILVVVSRSVAPGALKKAEGGQVVGRFKEIGFGGSFVEDAEAVELHAAAGSVLVSQSQQTGWSNLEDDKAESHESIIPVPDQQTSTAAKQTSIKYNRQVLA